METKRNYKYFATKGLSPLAIIGLVIIAAGIFFLFYIRDLGLLLAMVGIACLVFASGGRAKESDLNYQVSEKTKDMEERAMIRYEVYEKDFLKIVNPAKLHGYDYVTENVYYKYGADGKRRTSMYNGIQIFYTEDKLYIHGRRFSLIDDTDDTEFGGVYNYLDLDRAEYLECEKQLPKNKVAPYNVFRIVDNKGNDVVYISVSYGADVDKVIDDINHVIGLKKKYAAVK